MHMRRGWWMYRIVCTMSSTVATSPLSFPPTYLGSMTTSTLTKVRHSLNLSILFNNLYFGMGFSRTRVSEHATLTHCDLPCRARPSKLDSQVLHRAARWQTLHHLGQRQASVSRVKPPPPCCLAPLPQKLCCMLPSRHLQ